MVGDHFSRDQVVVLAAAVSAPEGTRYRFEIEDGEIGPDCGQLIFQSKATYETMTAAHEAGARWAYGNEYRIRMGG